MHSFGLTLARLTGIAMVRAGAVLAGCALAAAVAGVAWGTQDLMLTMAQPESSLTIEGSIAGVRAGAPSADLVLTLRNDDTDARTVTRVRVETTGVVTGPAACARGDYLSVGEWRGTTDVPGGGSSTVTIPVAVAVDLPSECVAVTWGLAYTAY